MLSTRRAKTIRSQRHRPLVGLLVLGAFGLQVQHALLGSWAFTGAALGAGHAGRPLAPRPHFQRQPALALAAAPGEAEEMSDFEQLIDRWNTRGGAVLATVLGLGAVWVFEKVLELAGVESLTAGIWTSGALFFGLLVWTSQYFTRVMTKSTTYAQQLEDYEREVMMRRLKELDEEEIAALCEEVGIKPEEISDAVDDKVKALSQKDQVLKLFKNTTMPKDVDPRAMMGS